MSRGPDIGTALSRAIELHSRYARCPADIVSATWQRWASATFTGARHRITVALLPCPATETWLNSLRDAEFDLRGHLVADVDVVAVRRLAPRVEADLEILTVETR